MNYVIINIDKLESRDRTSVIKIAAQNNKGCGCFLYKQETKNTKSQLPVFILMNLVGCIAHLTRTLSGDLEKNPGSFTQISNAIIVHLMRRTRMPHVPKHVNSVSLIGNRLSQRGRNPVNVLGDGNCFFNAVSRQLNNYHFHMRSVGVQHLLHHPGLYIESNVL